MPNFNCFFFSKSLNDQPLDIMLQALSDVRELRNPDKRREGEKKDNLTKAQSETSSAEPQTAETRASTVHETGERGAGGDLKKYNLPTYVTVVTVVIKKNLFKTKQFFFFVIL